MHIDKQILLKRIKILFFFAVYSPCCISSIVLLVHCMRYCIKCVTIVDTVGKQAGRRMIGCNLANRWTELTPWLYNSSMRFFNPTIGVLNVLKYFYEDKVAGLTWSESKQGNSEGKRLPKIVRPHLVEINTCINDFK